jgi:hypothetical protein
MSCTSSAQGGELTHQVQHPRELVHAFDWGLVAISLPRPCVEFMRDALAERLADASQAPALGQVLT